MKKILFILGTRPEVIKMSPVIKCFQDCTEFQTYVYTSGQHTDLAEQAIAAMNLEVNGKLKLNRINHSLPELTRELKTLLERLIESQNPDLVFVHGDTSTALVAAIAAHTKNKSIAHVEAGLRTYHLSAPYPEEANRQLIARLANYHFAPTESAKNNLLEEKVPLENILVTGNTGIDALKWAMSKTETYTSPFKTDFINKITEEPLLVVTAHRRENQKSGITILCEALLELEKEIKINIAFIAHPNPQLRKEIDTSLDQSPIQILDPLSYLDFVWLMSKAHLLLTDSGGIQEEAPTLKIPVLLLRELTERPEAMAAGGIEVVGINKPKIIDRVKELLSNEEEYSKMILSENPYGDGRAAERILDFVRVLYSV